MPTTISLSLKKLFLATVLLASVSLASGQTIIGGPDCAEWFKFDHSKSWLLGYLSGIDSMATEEAGALKKLSSPGQAILWMNNYCTANPLEDVVSGGLKLYLELQRKR